MGNYLSRKSKLDKIVVVIELAATYTRHTLHASFEKSEETTVQTSEKYPYCFFQLNYDEIGETFRNQTLVKLQTDNESRNNEQFFIRTLNLNQSLGNYMDLKDTLHQVFVFHQREAKGYIWKTFQKRIHKQDIQWLIILPAGTRLQSEIKEVAISAGLKRSRCQYVFPSDVLALYNAKEHDRNKTNTTTERESSQVSYVCFDDEFGEIGSYDVLQDGTICNNSRNTNQLEEGPRDYYIEQLLCCVFKIDFIRSYGMKYKYHFYMLYKDFEEQISQYDVAIADITLNCKHFVTKINEHHSMPVESLIHDSKYRDTVRYNADTSSLIFSQQMVQMIMEDFKLNVTECLKCLIKHHTSLICYLQMELCTCSDNFQQRLEQELQYDNGLLGSLACKEGETVTSDYTIGYIAIENFNKEQHSELNKTSLCHDNTGEECAIWIFRPLIKMGQQISSEFIWSESITFTSKKKKKSIHQAHVMRSKFFNPKYINEEGCELAATIQSHPPAEGWSDEVEFQYTLAVTENGPKIRVIDLKASQTITAEFTYKLHIKFLKDPSLVAMQSPTLAQLHPYSIKRRANHTYGIWTEPVFQEGRHPEHLRFVDSEGVSRCKAVFHKLIEVGQLLHYGQIFSATIPSTSWSMFLILCRSPLEDPRYIADPDDKCKVVATIDPASYHFFDSGYGKAKKFDVLLIVRDTDIMFKVINRKTGQEFVEYVDF